MDAQAVTLQLKMVAGVGQTDAGLPVGGMRMSDGLPRTMHLTRIEGAASWARVIGLGRQ